MKNLSNITIVEFRTVLQKLGLTLVRHKGGHEVWSKKGMTKPVIIQSHISPIPEFIIKNNLRTLGIDKQEFLKLLEG